MKKLLIIISIIIFCCVMVILNAPPGDIALQDYASSITDSKGFFRSKSKFKQDMEIVQGGTNSSGGGSGGSGSSGSSSGSVGTGNYVDIVLPDDMSQANLQIWLSSLSIAPERRNILKFLIDIMGTVPYTYGGQGRARYRQEPSTWGNGTDCSGMVTAAYYRGGIDFGQCYATSGMLTAFANQTVPREEIMPGDFSVVDGHTEVYLGHSSDGGLVFIGIRSRHDPPGPSVIKNHRKLVSAAAMFVRPTQLRAFDDAYYATQ